MGLPVFEERVNKREPFCFLEGSFQWYNTDDSFRKGYIMLHIEKNANGSELTIVLPWRLDATTAPELETIVNQFLTGVTVLIIDSKALEYISSAGLRVLLMAQKIMNKQGEMKVIHLSEPIMDIFRTTGFSDILNVV